MFQSHMLRQTLYMTAMEMVNSRGVHQQFPDRIVSLQYWLCAQWNGVCWLHKVRHDSMQSNAIQWAQINLRQQYIPFHHKEENPGHIFLICFDCRSISDVKMGRSLCSVSLRRAAMFLFTCKSRQHQWQLVHVNSSHQGNHLEVSKKTHTLRLRVRAMLLELQNKGTS